MALDNDTGFGGEGGFSGSDRALNDVAMSIGFSMMVLLFVVLSSITALQNIAVNLPQADQASTEEDKTVQKTPVVVVTLEADAQGMLKAVYLDDNEIDINIPLESRLEAMYENIVDAGAVKLQIRADGSLSHKTVSETVFRLNSAFGSIGNVPGKVTIRYAALEVE